MKPISQIFRFNDLSFLNNLRKGISRNDEGDVGVARFPNMKN